MPLDVWGRKLTKHTGTNVKFAALALNFAKDTQYPMVIGEIAKYGRRVATVLDVNSSPGRQQMKQHPADSRR